MRKGKKLELDCSNPNLNLVVGTVEDHNKSESVYLIHSTWVYDKGEGELLSERVQKFKRQLRYHINSKLYDLLKQTNFERNNYIIIIDIGDKNYNKSNKLHLSIEINLDQKKPFEPMEGKNLINQMKFISDEIFNVPLLKDNENLNFLKRRKKQLV